MSIDKREQILARVLEILEGLASDDASHAYRNRAALEDNELPAYVLLDGNEEKVFGSSDRRGPQIMQLLPHVFWVPVPPDNQVERSDLGPDVSEKRAVLIRAIMKDSRLADIVGANGYVEYRGMEVDMQAAGEVLGQFRMDWAMAYALNFNKL